MVITTLLSTLLSTFAIQGTPNLCDDAVLDASGEPVKDAVGQTLSRFCQWTGPDAPVWDADVCCTFEDGAAACSTVDGNGRCPSGTQTRYCEHGKLDALGGVTCYQPLPSMCDAGFCIEAPEDPPLVASLPMVACCENGDCHLITHTQMIIDCQGIFASCQWGISNADGTVDCFD